MTLAPPRALLSSVVAWRLVTAVSVPLRHPDRLMWQKLVSSECFLVSLLDRRGCA